MAKIVKKMQHILPYRVHP